MVGGYHLEPVRREVPQRTEQHVLGVALQAGDIDVAGRLAVALPAGRVLVGSLQDIELELGPNGWSHSQVGELLNHPLQHHPRTFF